MVLKVGFKDRNIYAVIGFLLLSLSTSACTMKTRGTTWQLSLWPRVIRDKVWHPLGKHISPQPV